jgi:hypothetical protein
MKIKFLVGCVLSAIISTNASALEITYGKLLSHQAQTTKNQTKKSLAEKNAALLTMLKQQAMGQDLSSGVSISQIYPSTGKIGEATEVRGMQTIMIMNRTGATQIYRIEKRICANTSEEAMECIESDDDIELDANGQLYDMQMPTMPAVFQKAGINETLVYVAILKKHALGGHIVISTAVSLGFASIVE